MSELVMIDHSVPIIYHAFQGRPLRSLVTQSFPEKNLSLCCIDDKATL